MKRVSLGKSLKKKAKSKDENNVKNGIDEDQFSKANASYNEGPPAEGKAILNLKQLKHSSLPVEDATTSKKLQEISNRSKSVRWNESFGKLFTSFISYYFIS